MVLVVCVVGRQDRLKFWFRNSPQLQTLLTFEGYSHPDHLHFWEKMLSGKLLYGFGDHLHFKAQSHQFGIVCCKDSLRNREMSILAASLKDGMHSFSLAICLYLLRNNTYVHELEAFGFFGTFQRVHPAPEKKRPVKKHSGEKKNECYS